MSAPDPGDGGWAGDVELDLLLLGAKASALNALDTTLDIAAGLAAIRVQPGRGTASRPPPARAGPGRSAKPPTTTNSLATATTSTKRKDISHERNHLGPDLCGRWPP